MQKESQPDLSFFRKLTSNKSLNANLIILLVIFLVIFIRNFPFETFYTGWDNLHPEFNFLMNFKRGLSAVWQENQGLGTYGGHGYAATLPHTIILFLMSFLIPLKYLRASFTFLTLLIGTLGVFFLIIKILSNHPRGIRSDTSGVYRGALFGALFYLLNFATIQNYYIQLEAFIVHYAALPWLFLTLINFLSNPSRKNLLIFTIVSLLSTVQGFIPPLFFVYLIILSIFLFFYVLIGNSNKPREQPTEVEKIPEVNSLSKRRYLFFLQSLGSLWVKRQKKYGIEHTKLNRLKKAFFILILTLGINSYWLLPVLHYSATQSQTYLNSYNNLTSTEDFILKNKKYGDLKDLIFLKGFLTETIDNDEAGNTFFIFAPWQKHLDKKTVQYIGYLFFFIILIGLARLIKDWKKPYNLALFAGFIVVFSFLATDTPPFSFISKILQEFPITKQAFRVAFTKFSISMAFFYALTFGLGIFTLFSLLKNNLSKAFSIICLILIIYFSLPAFTGNLLYKRTKLNIPKVYFDLFDFFKHENKNTRIANLPQGWHWGWSNYRWGYSGSGFLWYGIEQPTMDRAFDVWGKYNENYYWEISYAIYSENFPLFEKILDKYQVSWLLIDNNTIPYPNVKGFIYSDKLNDFINQSQKFRLEKVFKSNEKSARDIKVYKVNLQNPALDFKNLTNDYGFKNIGPIYNFTNYDQAYEKFGDYYSDPNKSYDIYFPFRTLFTGRETAKPPLNIEKTNNKLIFQTEIPKDVTGFSLNIQPEKEDKNKTARSIDLTNDYLKVSIAQNPQSFNYDSTDDPSFFNHEKTNCGSLFSSGILSQEVTDENAIKFSSMSTENCYSIILNNLPQRESYILDINSRNLQGKRLQFAAINHDSKKTDLEVSLNVDNIFTRNYLIIPPMKKDGTGYTLNFNNISIGNQTTINELKNINLTSFPFEFLTNINLTNPNTQKGDKLFVYYQSYNPFWKAYVVKNGTWQELKDHIIVNNWANGWNIDNYPLSANIVVIFWPQYLEYIGFILLLISFLFVFIKYRKAK